MKDKQKQLEKFCEGRDRDGVLKAALEHLVEVGGVSFMNGLPFWTSCGETLGDLPDIHEDEDYD